MTFDVLRSAENSSQLRIDRIEGAPAGLLLSDDALDDTYYQAHPIYFWDKTGEWLVPDVRYLPLTTEPEQRPNRVLAVADRRSVVRGSNRRCRLPPETESKAAVVKPAGQARRQLCRPSGGCRRTHVGAAEAGLPVALVAAAAPRNVFPDIELQIEGQTRDVGSYCGREALRRRRRASAARRFAIAERQGRARPPSGASPDPDSHARSGGRTAMSPRRRSAGTWTSRRSSDGNNGTMSLYVARGSGNGDPRPRRAGRGSPWADQSSSLDANGQLLVVSDGHLWAVDAKNRRQGHHTSRPGRRDHGRRHTTGCSSHRLYRGRQGLCRRAGPRGRAQHRWPTAPDPGQPGPRCGRRRLDERDEPSRGRHERQPAVAVAGDRRRRRRRRPFRRPYVRAVR